MPPESSDWNQPQSSVTELLSILCHGLTCEERRKKLNEHLSVIQKQYDDTLFDVERTKSSIEEARMKYENMTDMVRTLEQLKSCLDQHIRTVRLNESSFTGTSSVLEYDTAKGRTKNLISVIKARSQWDRAREVLKECGSEDQQKMYDCLADMQSSQDTLVKFISNGFEVQDFEDMKDRFLAWQSAALVFAIQQVDFEKLADIEKTYEFLGRKDEFISIFRRVSINRLREFSCDGASIQSIIDALYKELEFVFNHHYMVLRRFLNDDAAFTVLSEALNEGLNQVDLSSSFTNIVSSEENPIELLQKTAQVLLSRSEASSKVPLLGSISQQLKAEITRNLVNPFRATLTTYVLSKVNAIDLASGSYRARIESLKTAIVDLLHLLSDVFSHSHALFGRDLKQVVQHPIDKGLDNFFAKLKAWEYSVDSQGRPRSLEDAIAICEASGQLVFGLQEFRATLANTETSLSLNIKSALKWNRGVCDFVMRAAIDRVVPKMTAKIGEIKARETSDSHVTNLPVFGTPPHEYITTTAQELLQLFHRWEQFFLDENVVHSFYIALKKKFEGDELFKKTIADVANGVIASFVAAVGDIPLLSKDAAKQFLADTVFLKDAFEDLRTGDIEQLEVLESKLKNALK